MNAHVRVSDSFYKINPTDDTVKKLKSPIYVSNCFI